MNEIYQILINLAQQNRKKYQIGALYREGKNEEIDKVISKFHDFAEQFDKVCYNYPEEKQNLTLFLMIEYLINHGMI